jgi:hypothetical protein
MSQVHFASQASYSKSSKTDQSMADPHEGTRLIRAFLQIRSKKVRDEILHMVEEKAANWSAK